MPPETSQPPLNHQSEDARVVVDGRGARRARRGHPWIYSDNVVEAHAAHGDLVRVCDRSGAFLAWAAYSQSSRISLRRVARHEAPPDEGFWNRRLERALARRGDLATWPCYRLLHADADGFPGLTCDRYGDLLVVQATTAWADRVAPALCRRLLEISGASSLLARNDAPARAHEGLAKEKTALVGEPPETLWVEEGGVPRLVDPWKGHKTGLYLDQQESHRAAPSWLTGRVLDLFCAEGGFALPLALAGSEVLAVDQNAEGLTRAAAAAERAGVAGGIEWRQGNAFDVLAELAREGRRFDAVVLDPPPFARGRGARQGAQRGYRDLHRRALRLLAPGGRVLSFSCSFTVSAELFEQSAREGAEEAGRSLGVIARPGPAADHPERLELPESRYLRGLLLGDTGCPGPATPAP